nr:YhjD/YihY/BrkB family envelope integrity protein [Saccharopolyspora sp. HNM0983]
MDRLLRAAEGYQNQYGDYYAAAITYFSVLALVPLLMIAFAVAGFVLQGSPDLLGSLRVSITDAVPNPAMQEMLNRVVDQAVDNAGTVGIIGLLAALYSGLGWMTNLREALTAQWIQAPSRPPLVKRLGSDLFSLAGLGIALVLSFAISGFGYLGGRWLFELAGFEHTLLAAVVLRLLSLAANWLVFLWVLARLPRKPVTLRSAVWGAVFGAIGFEVLKQVGVIYLNSVTGSPAGVAFGPILGLLVFANLTSRFALFVTAWTAAARDNREEIPPPPPGPVVIRPAVRTRRGPGAGFAAGALGVGAALGWLLGRRR